MHRTDTLIAVFGKTFGSLCFRKCRCIPSLAGYRSTYKITKCLQPHWGKLQMCLASAFETYFEALIFLILTQFTGPSFSKFTVKKRPLLRQLLEACSFNLVEYFSPKNEIF